MANIILPKNSDGKIKFFPKKKGSVHTIYIRDDVDITTTRGQQHPEYDRITTLLQLKCRITKKLEAQERIQSRISK